MQQAPAVEPIPLGRLLPWTAAALFLVLVLYVVAFEQGLVAPAGTLLHEFMHDGRHLLGVPCH